MFANGQRLTNATAGTAKVVYVSNRSLRSTAASCQPWELVSEEARRIRTLCEDSPKDLSGALPLPNNRQSLTAARRLDACAQCSRLDSLRVPENCSDDS